MSGVTNGKVQFGRALAAIFSRGTLILALGFALAFSTRVAAADQGDLATTYARIRPSLAMVVAKEPKGYAFGSAFCIASTDSTSYFLTNRHVVSSQQTVDLFLVAHPGKIFKAKVVKTSVGALSWVRLDAAIIEVDMGGVPKLKLSEHNPLEGQNVAIAGFPATQIEFFADKLGLSPSLHEGTVNALPAGGFYIEYDAQTDHGNSGGPLFDPITGVVYGLVTLGIPSPASAAIQTNLAISALDLDAFLANARLPSASSRVVRVAEVSTPAPKPVASLRPQEPAAVVNSSAASSLTRSLELRAQDFWTSTFLAGVTFVHVRVSVVPSSDVQMRPEDFTLLVRDKGGTEELVSGRPGPAPTYYQRSLFDPTQQGQLIQTVDPREDLGSITASSPLIARGGKETTFVVTFELTGSQSVAGSPLRVIAWHPVS